MLANVTFYNDQELPTTDLIWTQPDGTSLYNFSSGWTFSVRLARVTAPATTVLLKSTGITGASTSPNLSIAWSTTDWSGLEASTNGTKYVGVVYARRTADSYDMAANISLTLKAAPGTSAVSPSSYPITVTAASVTLADTAGYYTETTVEAVLAEQVTKFEPMNIVRSTQIYTAPQVMSSPPTITLGTAFAASTITGSTQRLLGPSGALATFVRHFGGGTPSFTTAAGLSNTLGASQTWITDPVGAAAVRGTQQFEFMTDALEFEYRICCLTTSAMRYRVWVDNQPATADVSAGAGSGNVYYALKVVFASSTPRLVRLETEYATVHSVWAHPTYSFWKPQDRLGPRIAILGDSFTEGSTVASHHAWSWEMCNRLGWRDVYNCGLGGTGYLNSGTGGQTTFRGRVANDIIDAVPDWVFVEGGYNDTGSSSSAITAEAALLFAQIRTALPSCKLVVLSPLASSNTIASLQTVRDAVFAGAVGYADLTIDMISSTNPWIFGTGKSGATTGNGNADIYVNTDGVHYTRLGYQYAGHRVAQAVLDYLF